MDKGGSLEKDGDGGFGSEECYDAGSEECYDAANEHLLAIAYLRKIPWTAATSELGEHFAQFGHVGKCTVPFDKETGFHRGMGWIQFSSEELHNALQQENHVIDGKLNIGKLSGCGFGFHTSDATGWNQAQQERREVELVNNTFFKTQSLHPYLTISAPASCQEKTQLAKMIPGGLTEAKPATPEIQEIANTIRVGNDRYTHIKVFESLPHQNQSLVLIGYRADKSKDDELTGF
eukprot:bmy_03233T0